MRHAVGENEGTVAIALAGDLIGECPAMGIRAVDQFNSQAIERGEQGIDPVGALDFIRKIRTDFFVSKLSLGLTFSNKRLQIVIDAL
jgi:hypothetical protein